jgi:zinc transporter
VENWRADDAPVSLHLDRTSPRVQQWLRDDSGLTPITVEAQLAEETRPRTFYGKRGTVAILRGVNTNPGANPEDMLSLRIWSDGQRIITHRHHRLQTPRDILTRHLEDQTGPDSITSLFERLIARLSERMSGVIHGFDDLLDEVESVLTTTKPLAARKRIRETRQDILILRRYMAPQRDAVAMLHAKPPKWLDETDRLRLRETANRLMQYVEELDAAREQPNIGENEQKYVRSIDHHGDLPAAWVRNRPTWHQSRRLHGYGPGTGSVRSKRLAFGQRELRLITTLISWSRILNSLTTA